MRKVNVRKRGKFININLKLIYKYSTAKRYSEAFESIKKELGKYRLAYLTFYVLNQALLRIAQKVNSKDALRNYQKVIRSSLRDAAYYFELIENNPAADLQLQASILLR